MKILDRVLVIDFDEPSLVETVALFEHHGFDVVPAGSTDDVLRALEPGAPRMIVMEPVLPDRDGFELCRSILDSCIGVKPVVVLASTRIAGHEPHFRAKDVGAHMFIERPKQDEMLVQAVTTVMQAGGKGPDPAAPGRAEVAARRAARTILIDADGPDAPAQPERDDAAEPPVLDPSFAEWVDETFSPGANTDADADNGDELHLDAIDNDGIESITSEIFKPPRSEPEPEARTTTVAVVDDDAADDDDAANDERIEAPEVSPETALAVANRAAIVVSDAFRPAPEPRRWGGVIAVTLALLVTVGGATAWFVTSRSEVPPDRVDDTSVDAPASAPAQRVASITGVPTLDATDGAADGGAGFESFVEAADAVDGDAPIEGIDTNDTNEANQANQANQDPTDDVGALEAATAPPPVERRVTAVVEPVIDRAAPVPEPATRRAPPAARPAAEPIASSAGPQASDADAGFEPSAATDRADPAPELDTLLVAQIEPAAETATITFDDPIETVPSISEADLAAVERPPIVVPAPVVVEPTLLRRVAPRYPAAARRWNRGGRVVLRATIDSDGSVRDVEVTDEPVRQLGFGRAAAAAVRQWQYRPGTLDGIPVERQITVEVTFEP